MNRVSPVVNIDWSPPSKFTKRLHATQKGFKIMLLLLLLLRGFVLMAPLALGQDMENLDVDLDKSMNDEEYYEQEEEG